MDNTAMLNALKIDLGITTTAYDSRLAQYLKTARASIETEGIVLDDSGTEETPQLTIEDGNLVVMYAGWMWRKRDTGEGMPRMLRWQLNNRLFSQKVAENG